MPISSPEAPPTNLTSSGFDIVKYYNGLLTNDPALTRPVAAIESLITLLSTSPPSTISETLALLDSSTATLKASVSNPIALSAGTDLFQRYIISTLQARSTSSIEKGRRTASADGDDFQAIRAHLLANGKTFVQRAKEAPLHIGNVAKKFIGDGDTVLTCGNSRVVAAVLNAAAEDGIRFTVVYLRSKTDSVSTKMVQELRVKGVPVAIAPFAALTAALPGASLAMVGAESVVENGGIVSSMGTYQLGLLAKSAGKPFYVVAESHKFVRVYPIGHGDLIPTAHVLDFRLDDDLETTQEQDTVDFTPPNLISALITESGVHGPSAVSEELIKLWY